MSASPDSPADATDVSVPVPEAPRRTHQWARPTGPAEDPFAWLIQRDDPDTIAYLTAENTYADAWLGRSDRAELIETIFGEIKSRVQETDLSVPVLHHGWWYVTRTIEGRSYPVFCRGRDADVPDTADHVFLDCNAEADGHEYFDVATVEPDHDHALLAWSCDVDGSERYTLRVRDLSTGEDQPDELTDTSSWGGVAWSGDGQWLFYARPDEAMRPFQIWRHRLGTPVVDDQLVQTERDDRCYLGVSATRSGRWIIIWSSSKTSSEFGVIPGPTIPLPLQSSCVPALPTWSTASMTGATASSSSPTSTPPTSGS